MLKHRLLRSTFVSIWILLVSSCFQAAAQSPGNFPPLEFRKGERIVFLGGSLFENELKEGYIEFALATRWPGRELTFRNLGWTGDNVFGEARSTFTSTPTAYQQLFQQIRSTRPDYVLIAYGTVEAQKGSAGLDAFSKGLEVIIDSVDALGAQTILLSTIPVKLAGTPENTVIQNKYLKTYSDAISGIASKRKKRFIDLYTPVSQHKGAIYAYNGIHLNDEGYYYLAGLLEKAFGWPARGEKVAIDAAANSGGANSGSGEKVEFSIEEKLLPLPVPASSQETSKASSQGTPAPADPSVSVSIQIRGLKAGRYMLTENGKELLTASADELAKGITLDKGVSQEQSARLSDSIGRKNNLFFQQYRPLNRTYILGFREYEQGRHKKGLQDLGLIITRVEEEIHQHCKPVKKNYALSPVK
ncbi:lysophospholipase L1-like esterase [Anseongella ginsenosidimutans]|uniref:Lysophospholipase L1-like esterase n=1 Tax=Anseongella ginsenosidimutans TaxID=496056 RepID=A0A4R3KMA2_9SPHI|nr:GDSL-type esterase/lipase family protein [Anseongella ginsenosidimutans]QEC51893.1 GDSL family lipase [Anseongella ginsenosidimutans]TCS85085.1 lysophospholipase L1-like esterase [Anseongella ginsenosidimutans]